MTIFQKYYTALWMMAFLGALGIFLFDRRAFNFTRREYLRFLFKLWKVVTIILAILFVTLIGPYSGDYTWDYTDGFIMSVLTCFTAPWVMGTFYQFRTRRASLKQVYVAFCVWMFSVSWFFDLYIYISAMVITRPFGYRILCCHLSSIGVLGCCGIWTGSLSGGYFFLSQREKIG